MVVWMIDDSELSYYSVFYPCNVVTKMSHFHLLSGRWFPKFTRISWVWQKSDRRIGENSSPSFIILLYRWTQDDLPKTCIIITFPCSDQSSSFIFIHHIIKHIGKAIPSIHPSIHSFILIIKTSTKKGNFQYDRNNTEYESNCYQFK